MKKYLYLLCSVLITFVCMGSASALSTMSVDVGQCVKDASNNQICKPKLTYTNDNPNFSRKFNTMKIKVFVSNATMQDNITFSEGIYFINKTDLTAATRTVREDGIIRSISGHEFTLTLGTRKTLWPSSSTIDLGTYVFHSDAQPCYVLFSYDDSYFDQRNECQEVDGYFYDNNGNNVNEETYRKICFMCKEDNGRFYGKNGQALNSREEYDEECGEKKYCDIVNGKYYGPNGDEVSFFQFYELCRNPICLPITDGENIYYYDINGQKVETEAEYLKSCFNCSIDADGYHGIDGEVVSEIEYRKQCLKNTCEILGNSYYDKDGKEVSKEEYQKSCFSCAKDEINGKYYDKNGAEATEKEYLKSCFACRKENGKYYDTTGKETTESEWNAICTPHKCEIIGDHYFNDMGKDVPKAEYDKACKNPKTGISETKMLYLYVIAGFTLFAGILVGTKKFSKISKF